MKNGQARPNLTPYIESPKCFDTNMIQSYAYVGNIVAFQVFGNGRTAAPTAVETALPYGSGDDAMSIMLSAGLYKILTICMAIIAVGIFLAWAWPRMRGE